MVKNTLYRCIMFLVETLHVQIVVWQMRYSFLASFEMLVISCRKQLMTIFARLHYEIYQWHLLIINLIKEDTNMVESNPYADAESAMPASVYAAESDVLMNDMEYDFSVANP